mgnify:FL=1
MFIEPSIRDKVEEFLETAPENMSQAIGIEFLSFKKDEVKASMPVNGQTIQPFGILHGGASVALAETVASIGAWLNIDHTIKAAVGIEINANHIRAVPAPDVVTGTAVPIQRGNQIHVWEISITRGDGKLVCVSRCTLAIIDKRQ